MLLWQFVIIRPSSNFYAVWIQLRRERIAERIRALQDLVPSVNKVSVSLFMALYKLDSFACFLGISWRELWNHSLSSFKLPSRKTDMLLINSYSLNSRYDIPAFPDR